MDRSLKKYRHSLTIMRAQPFHIGHARIIDLMLSSSENVTVLLGSIQERGTDKNPLSYSDRKKMLFNVYGASPDYCRMRIIGIHDLNNPPEWAEFVLDFVADAEADKPPVDAYFAGSEYDADLFRPSVPDIVIIDRADRSFPFVSASMVRQMLANGDDRWHDFIHPENYEMIEHLFFKKNEEGK